MNNRQASRYPGIRSFERSEQTLFFGRSRETQELFEAVKVKPLTVLFSKSGIGKTSLLNAGLTPVLVQNAFLPIFIRLQDTAVSPVETVQKVLSPFLDAAKLKKFGKKPYSLWEYVRACSFGESLPADTEQPVARTPVLIFDQFEELFSHERPLRDALTLALADLLNERLPEGIRLGLREYPREQRSNELLEWYEPLKIKMVFAIRADRLSDLDELKYHIPTVLNDRFQLKPLSHENAREAIIQPALLTTLPGDTSFSPAFDYEATAVSEILEALDNEQGEIESFQLQLLCSYLETKVERKGQVITSADYSGKAGIETILNDYYEREINALNPSEQLAVRRFIEEGLIVNGRRVGLPEGAEQTRFGIGTNLLNKLLNSRLLRTETIHLGKIYELSHDTLIEPILRSYEKRRAEEERRQVQLLLAETQRKRARARLLATTGFILFALALTGGVFAWLNAQKAQKARVRAEANALSSKAWNIYREDQTLAFRIAQSAYESDTTNGEALQTIQKIINEPTTAFYQTVFSRHAFEVRSLAFSPDGSRVASGGLDSEVYVWDFSGKIVSHLPHGDPDAENTLQSAPVESVAFSKDGKILYTAERYGGVRLWDLNADTVLLRFKTHGYLNDMTISPDERWILTCGSDSTAKIWDKQGRLFYTLKGHTAPVTTVAFSADNQFIATGSSDHTARIWNMDGTIRRIIQIPANAGINDVRFSPDGKLLAMACSDNTARIFDLNSQAVGTLSGHAASVSNLLFSPDGKYVLTTSYDHTAKLWNINGEEILRLAGHSERISSVAFSPDGNWLVTGGFDFQAKLWNLKFNLGNNSNRHTDYVNKVKVAPDGAYLISGSADSKVRKWSLEGELLFEMSGHKSNVTSVDISSDGARFLSASEDKTIRLWADDGRPLRTISESREGESMAIFAPDNRYIVSCNLLGEIAIFESETGQLLRKWSASPGMSLSCIDVSPDGQRIYSGGGDGVLRAWTWAGELVWVAEVGVNIWSIAVSPDGKNILTGAEESSVKIWNAEGQLVRKCFGHLNVNYHVVWSSDGTKFASSSWDRTAKIWDKDGNCLQTLSHPDGVNGAGFSPSGLKLFTACRDKIIRVWEMPAGQMLHTIGRRTSVQPFFDSPHIAKLAAIPFDLERYDIDPKMADEIYRSNPENLTRLGMLYLTKAENSLSEFAVCSRYLTNAEDRLLAARHLNIKSPSNMYYDSLVAEVYSMRCYLLLLNRKYEETVKTAQAGMQFKPLDYLKIYEVNGLLLSGKFEEAVRKGTAIKNDPVLQIDHYPNMTFKGALRDELEFFRDEYGIESPDFERFIQRLE